MTKEKMAVKLNGREYGQEVSAELSKAAEAVGLIIIYGASYDLLEFDGAVAEELAAHGGKIVKFGRGAEILEAVDDDERETLERHHGLASTLKRYADAPGIQILWDTMGYSWVIEPFPPLTSSNPGISLPFAPFDIWEHGTKFCRGVVIDKADIAAFYDHMEAAKQ